jgi:hypothetical protein
MNKRARFTIDGHRFALPELAGKKVLARIDPQSGVCLIYRTDGRFVGAARQVEKSGRSPKPSAGTSHRKERSAVR